MISEHAEWLLEQFLSGKKTYFRGLHSQSETEPDIKSVLSSDVLYMTSHFGYALAYTLDVPKFTFSDFSIIESKIEITNSNLSKMIDRNKHYWIFPIKIDKMGDIFSGWSVRDQRILYELMFEKTDFSNKHPNVKGIGNVKLERISEFLAKHDWLFAESDSETMLGLKRSDLIELLSSPQSAYDGYWNYDMEKFSAIGIFKKSLEKMSAGKPLRIWIVTKGESEFLEIGYAKPYMSN